ncbi:MAG: GNAT family N-acetyltransferase [Candidatus Bathyarchaeia archaeon]
MIEDVFIRKFQPSDLDACRSLWRELVEWHRTLYGDKTIGGEHPETYFDKHLSRVGEKQLWVAVLGSKVVGFTGLISRENEGEIEPLIVTQGHRHKGIGTKLINTVMAEAQRTGLKSLSIKPVLRNVEAIQLFNNQGFRSIGQIELYIDFSKRHRKKNLELLNLPFDF